MESLKNVTKKKPETVTRGHLFFRMMPWNNTKVTAATPSSYRKLVL